MVFCSCINTVKESDLICIDPGHGGIDAGASAGNVYEKEINLIVALNIREVLEGNGYKCILTREGDYDLSYNSKRRKKTDMDSRIKLINKSKMFVSIHTNKFSDKSVHGAQIFYKNENSKMLSEIIQNNLNTLNNTNKKTNKLHDKYLLDNTNIVGCIVEIGFLSNEYDLKNLTNKTYQKSLSNIIAYSIIDYLNIGNNQ